MLRVAAVNDPANALVMWGPMADDGWLNKAHFPLLMPLSIVAGARLGDGQP
jgi:hypothetical protein